MTLKILDATGAQQTMSTTPDAGGTDQVGASCIADPASGVKQAVGSQHLTDSNALPGNSALVSGVNLQWNGSTYDRERNNEDAAASICPVSAQGAGLSTGLPKPIIIIAASRSASISPSIAAAALWFSTSRARMWFLVCGTHCCPPHHSVQPAFRC